MQPTAEDVERASTLMSEFAQRTGLTSDGPKVRYLWTDAFAVCNYLGLAQLTGDAQYMELALRLVEQVHHVLGRYRPEDPRTGWLSGLSEEDGARHPTCAGLRIGKKLPERTPGEALDERLEWDRDGQYFHYLTKWMRALHLVSRAARDPQFHVWARELAEVAHPAFTYGPHQAGMRRMVWKMSTDLSRPLVPSMGQHDPLDGLITCAELHVGATSFSDRAVLSSTADRPPLQDAIADFAGMLRLSELGTRDPLGLGSLLSDAYRVAQLMTKGVFADGRLLATLLSAGLSGLRRYSQGGELRASASQRLAFRELGLAIGLAAIELMSSRQPADPHPLATHGSIRNELAAFSPYLGLGKAFEAFWLAPEHRQVATWTEHKDINDVMLVTRLVPHGFLAPETELHRDQTSVWV